MNDRSSRLQISASRISNMNFGIIRINLLVLWGIAGYNEGYNPNMHNFVLFWIFYAAIPNIIPSYEWPDIDICLHNNERYNDFSVL